MLHGAIAERMLEKLHFRGSRVLGLKAEGNELVFEGGHATCRVNHMGTSLNEGPLCGGWFCEGAVLDTGPKILQRDPLLEKYPCLLQCRPRRFLRWGGTRPTVLKALFGEFGPKCQRLLDPWRLSEDDHCQPTLFHAGSLNPPETSGCS